MESSNQKRGPGAPRPSVAERKVHTTVILYNHQLDTLQNMADLEGWSLCRTVREVIDRGLGEGPAK